MAEVVRMPKMSDTMTEGVLAKWHKKVGDKVKTGDLVAEIETDKATMEFESYQEGTLLYIGIEEGKAVPVDGIIAVLGKEDEDYKALLTETPKPATEAKAEVKAEAPKPAAPKTELVKEAAPVKVEAPKPVAAPVSSSSNDSRLKASPLAKKLAEDKGIDLNGMTGTGEHGRIVKRDIDWYKPSSIGGMQSSNAPAFVGKESYEEVPVSQMRKVIAKRLAESKFTAPHFYLTMEINMDKAIEAREAINTVATSKISFNDMVIKATAAALRQNPKANSSWLDDKIRYNHHINIGVAVAVEEGLLVPVVRFADGKTLSQISAEVKVFGQKAKEKKLQPADWEGNTFTISNLGMFGIEEFTAIINPPDACILAVGGIKQVPIVKNGQIVLGNVMKVTLSCDHRVVDGAVGSGFLKSLKNYLENPVLLLGQASI
jgi:pyruvate dehydrogenase E2 component (dihydrolipoamide acetyltransferase)